MLSAKHFQFLVRTLPPLAKALTRNSLRRFSARRETSLRSASIVPMSNASCWNERTFAFGGCTRLVVRLVVAGESKQTTCASAREGTRLRPSIRDVRVLIDPDPSCPPRSGTVKRCVDKRILRADYVFKCSARDEGVGVQDYSVTESAGQRPRTVFTEHGLLNDDLSTRSWERCPDFEPSIRTVEAPLRHSIQRSAAT